MVNCFCPTYSKIERSLGAGRVCEVAQCDTCVRLGNHGTVNAALGVIEQRSYTRHSGGSLEEESHGERLEAVEGVAEIGELQLRLGTAVEEAAFAIHTIVATQLDVLVEEPQTI